MCSFLLLFLLILVGWDLIQNYNPNRNPENEGTPLEASGAPCLVFTPQGGGATSISTKITKQKMEMELWPWQCGSCHRINKKSIEKCYKVYHLPCTLDKWNSSQYPTEAAGVCLCMSVCLYACLYVCTYVCMYMSVYVCVCMYMSVYACICLCMSVYVCVCLCMSVYVCVCNVM